MGIVNVAPDSFSGDGVSPASVLERVQTQVREGADIVDLGGESTRPQAAGVSQEEELARVIPALSVVRQCIEVAISVDTQKAEVARQALQRGATIVNDVSGLRDPEMKEVVASAGAGVVIVHSRRERKHPDVLDDVLSFLEEAAAAAIQAGVREGAIAVDPGFGFAKRPVESLRILGELRTLRRLGFPVVMGMSRKGTIGAVLDLPVDRRLEGSLAAAVLAVAHGVDMVRVHDVEATLRAVRFADAVIRG
ncbi:MAG TPA: dihydropteroate synthase [Chloroflexota bacterium]|nr:dihydropteroate synthase [Chloroflexota bacterium]